MSTKVDGSFLSAVSPTTIASSGALIRSSAATFTDDLTVPSSLLRRASLDTARLRHKYISMHSLSDQTPAPQNLSQFRTLRQAYLFGRN